MRNLWSFMLLLFLIFLILSGIMSIIATVLWKFTAMYEEKLTKYLIWRTAYKIYQIHAWIRCIYLKSNGRLLKFGILSARIKRTWTSKSCAFNKLYAILARYLPPQCKTYFLLLSNCPTFIKHEHWLQAFTWAHQKRTAYLWLDTLRPLKKLSSWRN